MLGTEWKDLHEEWLHRLANLTLTAYNSSYSNRSFEDKKNMAGGFRESAVRLNKFVREQSEWTNREMSDRGKQLAARAVEIWPSNDVEKTLVKEAEVQELRRRAAFRGPDTLNMSDDARRIFSQLDSRVRELAKLIVTVERQSACYYSGSDLVLEILPQKRGVRLLLDIAFAEVDDPKELAQDANDWKFIPNAAFSGWEVLVDVWRDDQMEDALSVVRQALDLEAQ